MNAFETLYRQHAPRLHALATRMAGSPQDGEDLLQEIFLQAYRKLGSFKGDAALGTWLYRLAVNHCLDYVRSRQAKMSKLTDTLDDEAADEPVARRDTPVARLDLERAIRSCPTGAARRSCCTTSKDSITRRSPTCSASRKGRRSRRCSRRA